MDRRTFLEIGAKSIVCALLSSGCKPSPERNLEKEHGYFDTMLLVDIAPPYSNRSFELVEEINRAHVIRQLLANSRINIDPTSYEPPAHSGTETMETLAQIARIDDRTALILATISAFSEHGDASIKVIKHLSELYNNDFSPVPVLPIQNYLSRAESHSLQTVDPQERYIRLSVGIDTSDTSIDRLTEQIRMSNSPIVIVPAQLGNVSISLNFRDNALEGFELSGAYKRHSRGNNIEFPIRIAQENPDSLFIFAGGNEDDEYTDYYDEYPSNLLIAQAYDPGTISPRRNIEGYTHLVHTESYGYKASSSYAAVILGYLANMMYRKGVSTYDIPGILANDTETIYVSRHDSHNSPSTTYSIISKESFTQPPGMTRRDILHLESLQVPR